MTKFFCDDCDKALDKPPLIVVREVIFMTSEGPKAMQGLHFCDHKCMNSFIVKAANKPNLIIHDPR